MIRRDVSEAVANAASGYLFSLVIVAALRALGLWDMPAVMVTGVFFVASIGRSFVLRRMFRAREAQ